MGPTQKQIELYKKLLELTKNTHVYSDQMLEIAIYIDIHYQEKINNN